MLVNRSLTFSIHYCTQIDELHLVFFLFMLIFNKSLHESYLLFIVTNIPLFKNVQLSHVGQTNETELGSLFRGYLHIFSLYIFISTDMSIYLSRYAPAIMKAMQGT